MQGALNPVNMPLLSYEAIAAAVTKHNEQQTAAAKAQLGMMPSTGNRSGADNNAARLGKGTSTLPDDPLGILSEYMTRAKVQLATLLSQFDADRDGQLSGKEAAKMLRFAAGARLKGRALERAMEAWRRVVDVDGDGFVSYTVRGLITGQKFHACYSPIDECASCSWRAEQWHILGNCGPRYAAWGGWVGGNGTWVKQKL